MNGVIRSIENVINKNEHERITKLFMDINKLGTAKIQNDYNKLVMKGQIRI